MAQVVTRGRYFEVWEGIFIWPQEDCGVMFNTVVDLFWFQLYMEIHEDCFLFSLRGDANIHWLQPPYIQQPAAANLYRKSYEKLLNAAAIWLQPDVVNFEVFPHFKALCTSTNILYTNVDDQA